jgi:hypothetical protein
VNWWILPARLGGRTVAIGATAGKLE